MMNWQGGLLRGRTTRRVSEEADRHQRPPPLPPHLSIPNRSIITRRRRVRISKWSPNRSRSTTTTTNCNNPGPMNSMDHGNEGNLLLRLSIRFPYFLTILSAIYSNLGCGSKNPCYRIFLFGNVQPLQLPFLMESQCRRFGSKLTIYSAFVSTS